MLAKSSTPCDVANLEPPVARLERQPVDELHQAGHGLAAAQVRDVDAFDRPRRLGQLAAPSASPASPFLGSMGNTSGCTCVSSSPRSSSVSEHVDLVAQPGGLLELQLAGRRRHLLAHLVQQPLACCLPGTSAAGGCRGGTPPSRSAGCTAPCTGRCEASRHGRNQRHLSSPSSMSSVQVRNLKIFCSTWIAPAQAAGAGERPVELRAPRAAARA